MTCPECNGSGAVIDEHDELVICDWCDGIGGIALTEDGKTEDSK